MSNFKIEELDSNFKTAVTKEEGMVFYDVALEPSLVYGLPWFDKKAEFSFCRIPPNKLDLFSEGVRELAWHTSGVRLKFRTDSPTVALDVKLRSGYDMSHMPRTGISGFDFYKGSWPDRKYIKTIMPDSGAEEYRGEACSDNSGEEEWLIFFPLYNGVKSLQLGIKEGCSLEMAEPYAVSRPVVFYGSSITQGGCASRTGNAYHNIISRWLDADIYNLGFSGNAMGEPEMAEYISFIDMSALVMDYDHNAPTVEHLAETHEPFFRHIRAKRPDLPVIFISKPDFDSDVAGNNVRREVILKTYRNAVSAGDKNVYYIDGEQLFGTEDRDSCTVDGCHPNDLGFMRMAQVILPVLKKALNIV